MISQTNPKNNQFLILSIMKRCSLSGRTIKIIGLIVLFTFSVTPLTAKKKYKGKRIKTTQVIRNGNAENNQEKNETADNYAELAEKQLAIRNYKMAKYYAEKALEIDKKNQKAKKVLNSLLLFTGYGYEDESPKF